ncbi:MAG: CPBP family intramembrane glutamic endopeptidase [Bacillota bacterium]
MKKTLTIWLSFALIVLTTIVFIYSTSIPIFTYVWLIVPLIVLFKDGIKILGTIKVPKKILLKYTLVHFVLLSIMYLVFEPWSNAYRLLIELAVNASPPDPTFIWLSNGSEISSLIMMFLITLFITIFGEELFFRGYLYQRLKDKLSPLKAIIFQAVLFALPNLIVTFMMPLVSGIVYVFVYAFLGVGCIGGYTAYKTDSIWPSLISASLMNLILVVIFV